MTSGGKKRATIGGINITPLTDIFLVLLIIMMLLPIIEMKELQLNIKPTTKSATPNKEKPKTFKMQVLADGFKVGKDAIESAALAERLKKDYAEFPDGLVIEVDPKSRHEQFAQALSAAKLAGITKVGVQRQPEPKAAAPAPPTGEKKAPAPKVPKTK